MEKDAAGFPQGPTNSGISRYLASRLPYIQSGSEGGGGNGALWPPRRPPTLRNKNQSSRAGGPHFHSCLSFNPMLD